MSIIRLSLLRRHCKYRHAAQTMVAGRPRLKRALTARVKMRLAPDATAPDKRMLDAKFEIPRVPKYQR